MFQTNGVEDRNSNIRDTSETRQRVIRDSISEVTSNTNDHWATALSVSIGLTISFVFHIAVIKSRKVVISSQDQSWIELRSVKATVHRFTVLAFRQQPVLAVRLSWLLFQVSHYT